MTQQEQEQPQPTARCNVVVFGETGAGKSSVVNLIVGREVAKTSSDATGCTFKSESYEVDIEGVPLTLWDTSGLNEGDKGKVAGRRAIAQLYQLIGRLEKEGVSLLVFCVRGPRVKETTIKNYRLFFSGFCQAKVPIVLVVTGLEGEESMDAWWLKNKISFDAEEMLFNGQACVTATKGKLKRGVYIYEEEYEESRKKVRKAIVNSYRTIPWKMERLPWFVAVLRNIAWFFKFKLFGVGSGLYEVLREYGGYSDKDARKVAEEAEDKNGEDAPE